MHDLLWSNDIQSLLYTGLMIKGFKKDICFEEGVLVTKLTPLTLRGFLRFPFLLSRYADR